MMLRSASPGKNEVYAFSVAVVSLPVAAASPDPFEDASLQVPWGLVNLPFLSPGVPDQLQ